MKMNNDCLVILNLCYGVIRELSIFHCKEAWQIIDNIIKESENYNNCLIINDLHQNDDLEFKYLPPHMISISEDTCRLYNIEKQLKCPFKQFYNKKTFSPLKNEHLRKLIMDYDNILVSGFSLTFDIVPTVLDLITFGKNTKINKNCVGDISTEHKNKALEFIENFIKC